MAETLQGDEGEPDPGFGLYLHWPFCQSKCPYCDFNSHVVPGIDQGRWLQAYLAEIARAGAETPGRVLRSVFFGGGTPSLMDPASVAAILEAVRRTWPMTNDPEITLEANPGTVEAGRFADFRQAGINRVSIGVQAMDDTSLRQLGRMHSAAEAVRAVEIAQALFPRFSFDLIYARQGQGLAEWRRELTEALAIGSRHLSLYQLTIEEGTVFHERNRRGMLQGLPDEDLAADLYLLTQDMCAAAGMPAYEVSNHAVPGEESRHNLIYWKGGDYLGIGPGAHGRLTLGGDRVATVCHSKPDLWLRAVAQAGSGEMSRQKLDPQDIGTEYCLMGLRLVEGLSLRRLEGLLGRPVDAARLEDLVAAGLVNVDGSRLRTTADGMMVLNSILRELLA